MTRHETALVACMDIGSLIKEKIMAEIIKANGERESIEPKNGKDFKLDELREIVNGWVEVVWLPNDKIMIVNEDGKLLDLPINQEATTIYQKTFGFNDMIVGDVLLCDANQVE